MVLPFNMAIKTLDGFKQLFLADFTFSIHCFEWPLESNWSFHYKDWPDCRVVATIKNLGFHFVPRNRNNDKSRFTWRYSISTAEIELSKHVYETARTCFLCLKIITTDYLKPICKKLSSYHLKTVLFHTLQGISAREWSQKNIVDCLDYLLEVVQNVFLKKSCNRFWISTINLFQNLDHLRLSRLVKKVKEVRENPFPFLVSYSTKFMRSCLPCLK